MKKTVLALTVFTLLSTDVFASASYLCITDLVSGLHHDGDRGNWKHANFLPGEKYTISEQRNGVYEVKKLGDGKTWSAICAARADLTDDSFICTSGTDQFNFNRQLLRFTSFRFFGYWNGSTDSLSISMGQCFPN